MIFDEGERTDPSSLGSLESIAHFLNRASGVAWDRVRGEIEQWFSRVCDSTKTSLAGRIRSDDDRQMGGAFWELYCHESLIRLGLNVECEPEIEGSTRHPDFRATKGATTFIIEATLAATSDSTVAVDRLQATVFEKLDGLQLDDLLLHVNIRRRGEVAPSVRKLKSLLRDWAQGLDRENLRAKLTESSNVMEPSLPKYHWEESGWEIDFYVMPRDFDEHVTWGNGVVGIKLRTDSVFFDSSVAVKKALEDKAGAYGAPNTPYVIAVASDIHSPGDIGVLNALFGHEQVTFGIDQMGETVTQEGRAPDGFWIGPSGPRNQLVSAVLVASWIRPWFVSQNVPTIWHNPYAVYPLALSEAPWRSMRIVASGELEESAPAQSIHDFFELDRDWPGPDDLWGF